jgi:hypothetical protein
MFWAAVSAFRPAFCNRAGTSSSFGQVSEDMFETFSVLLCGFSVLHWHGVFQPVFCSRAGNVVSSFSLAWCFLLREPCFGLPCLLFSVFFAAVLAMSFLALLEGFQRRR